MRQTNSFSKFYGKHVNLIIKYEGSVSDPSLDSFPDTVISALFLGITEFVIIWICQSTGCPVCLFMLITLLHNLFSCPSYYILSVRCFILPYIHHFHLFLAISRHLTRYSPPYAIVELEKVFTCQFKQIKRQGPKLRWPPGHTMQS